MLAFEKKSIIPPTAWGLVCGNLFYLPPDPPSTAGRTPNLSRVFSGPAVVPLHPQAMLNPFPPILGRTGLIIGASEGKNAGEADFDIKMRVALQKPGQNCENHEPRTQIF